MYQVVLWIRVILVRIDPDPDPRICTTDLDPQICTTDPDPRICTTDPDPQICTTDPDRALYVFGFQGANKNKWFFCLLIFESTVEIKVFRTFFA
jgi:hypothetical protein